MMSRVLFLAVACLLVASSASATTYNAADCQRATVATLIAGASAGDIVTLPACGSEDAPISWTTGVTLNGIKVQGAGSGRVVAYSPTLVTLATGTRTYTLGSSDGGAAWPAPATGTFTVGQALRLYRTGDVTQWMDGTVTSYTSPTLVMNITSVHASTGPAPPFAPCSGSACPANLWMVSTKCVTCLQLNAGITNPGGMFTMTENTTVRSELAGIKIIVGTGTGFPIIMNRTTNGLAMLVHDMFLDIVPSQTVEAGVFISAMRGVIWNFSCTARYFSQDTLCVQMADNANASNGWGTPATMGAADTTGANNIYFENSDFHGFLNAFDGTNNARWVVRYSKLNHAAVGSHGQESATYGMNHVEVYNNGLVFDGFSNGTTINLVHWYLIRGGTFVFTDNVYQCCVGNDYGAQRPNIALADYTLEYAFNPVTSNSCWGQDTSGGARYPNPRQVGYMCTTAACGGNDGGGIPKGQSVPGYSWNNSGGTLVFGALDFGLSDSQSCPTAGHTYDVASNYIVDGRDYFQGIAKPGYTKYTYPHPFTQASGTVSASNSSVVASISPVTADGVSMSTITVTLLDTTAAPVAGKTVSLGQAGGASTITPASGVSASDGTVTFTVKNSTVQSVTYTATDTTDAIVITQTASVSFIAITTTCGVTSSLNPSTLTQTVTFTALITPASAPFGSPTGTVTFKDGTTTLGTGTAPSSATFPTSALSAGAHSITVVYAGDSHYGTCTSNPLTQTVNSSGPTTGTTIKGAVTIKGGVRVQ